MDCIFCRIVAGDLPSHKVYEDDTTLAFLDINPATQGHTLVIPRQHAADLHGLTPEVMCDLARTTQAVARILQNGIKPDGINIIQNNGAAAGQEVFHYHAHVIPRWTGDKAVRLWRPGTTDHAAFSVLAAELRGAGGT